VSVKPLSEWDSDYVESLEQKAEKAATPEEYRAAMNELTAYKGSFIPANATEPSEDGPTDGTATEPPGPAV